MKDITRIMQVVSIVCACVAAGAVLIWAPVCSGTLELANGNMVPMRCAYTAKVELLLAILLIVACVVGIVTKRSMVVMIAVLSLAMILMTFDTPLSIGVCRSADMACQSTAIWLRVAGGISLVAALVGVIANPNRKRVTA